MPNDYGLTKEKIVKRILKSSDNVYYKKEAVSEIIDLYINEMVKALMDGEKVSIPHIGTITPHIKQPRGKYNLPTCDDFKGENMPYIKLYYNINRQLRELLDRRLLKNLKETHKLELSEGKPPIKRIEVEWGKIDWEQINDKSEEE